MYWLIALFTLSTPAAIPAQAAPTATAAPATAPLTIDSPIQTIAADPAGKAVLDKVMPKLLSNPSYEQFRSMSLKQLQGYSSGAITDEKIAAVDAGLKAIKPTTGQ